MSKPAATNAAQAAADIRRFIDIVRRGATESLLEVRVLDWPVRGRGRAHEGAGYFVDADKAVAEIRRVLSDVTPGGFYITVNRPDPLCHPRSPDVLTEYQETTTNDKDILRRLWLFLDFDAKRPAKVSATDAMVERAKWCAGRCRDMLSEEFGWPAPVEVDSGNGAYLLYPIDLPNDDASRDLIKAILERLAGKCAWNEPGQPEVHLDRTAHNAARVMRLAGTTNRKGKHTEKQPHRRSGVTFCPDQFVLVTVEQLRELAGTNEAQPNQPASRFKETAASGTDRRFKMAEYLADRAVKIHKTKTVDGWQRWYVECPFDSSHGGHTDSYFALSPSGARCFHCSHESCAGRKWEHAKERVGKPDPHHHDPPYTEANGRHETNGHPQASETTPGVSGAGKQAAPFSFTRITCRELFTTEYRQEYLVDDVLIAGQPFIIGAPKKALKTTLMLAQAIALDSATPFLSKFRVGRRVRSGIMSGESGQAVIQETMRRIARAQGYEPGDDDGIRLSFQVPRLNSSDHLDALERFIAEDALEVLFIDPTYLALPVAESASNLLAVGELLLGLTNLGQKTGCTIGLLHHLRKNVADPFTPPELEDLAWSGFAEWARQWVLIGRREKFDADSDGEHKLWLNIGGSAGHCSLWALDVIERRRTDPGGRRWSVFLGTASRAREDAVQQQQEHRNTKRDALRQAATAANRERILKAFRRFPEGETKSGLEDAAGMNGKVFGPILGQLIEEKIVVPCQVMKGRGTHGYHGYRLREEELFATVGQSDKRQSDTESE